MRSKATFITKLLSIQLVLLMFMALMPQQGNAQYFGQNKMRYKKLDFKVFDTPHFNIYYYLQNDSMMNWLAKESEVWYELHQQVFQDTFLRKNPIILYNNHPEFQQTTAISGEISVGTGGVTEAFKQRVVMPVMQINQQTRHVLGHEMVHAFQYRVLIEGGDSTRLESVANIPLWMVEGMAEYFSIGKKDAFTSMWMRDAYARNDIPSLGQMTENMNKYFPYRYGQAFWSYVGSTYGDTVIMPLFIETAKYGYEGAIRRVFGYDAQTMSTLWRSSMENTYRGLGKDTTSRPIGQLLLSKKNAGRMNVAPAISPDGKYVAFLSELDLFGIDLFLADANTGKVLRKLGSRTTNNDIDEFSFIESAGTFSPDSKKFAFSVFSEGKNKLMILDVESGKTVALQAMGETTEFTNITWAPQGDLVAFSGLKNGFSDIYTYNLSTKELVQLTNDKYSDFQPSFSRDGKYIVFSTDRVSLESGSRTVDIPMSLATIDLQTKEIKNLPIFPGANNLNPHFSSNSKEIYFLSNSDGFRNMFRYNIETGALDRMTDFFTGISGITEYSPAMSISANDDIVYSYFKDNAYTVYKAKSSEFEPVPVDPGAVNFEAAMLPPVKSYGVNVVNTNLQNFNAYGRISDSQIKNIPYKPKFKLDYLANSGVGMSVGSRYGAGIASGIQGMFSDILGYNQIFAAANINGEIYDFGGQIAYINQRSRWNWGGSLSHIPYRFGFYDYAMRDLGNGTEPVIDQYLVRSFQSQIDAFVAYPFSRHHRFEMGGAASYNSYRVDRFTQSYYNYYGTRERVPNDTAARALGVGNLDPFNLMQVNAGFVGDKAVFGVAAPLQGFRYRLGVEQYFGTFQFSAVNVDLRKYHRMKPFTIAARLYSYMRLGNDADRLYNIYIGYPYLVRGFESNSFGPNSKIGFNDLSGSKMVVGNFEVRLPFTGPEKLAVLPSGFLFSDLNLFVDAGLAWRNGSKITWQKTEADKVEITAPGGQPYSVYPDNLTMPVFSAGVSLRINLFGAMILEPYYAIQLNNPTRSKFGTFGLNFAPGW
ncbi:DPP IV N-terminal domain-containing protein [Sphingobacterium lactis]|uniref:DPP IV N-terminal domain-containing protein n=1 Tax=Sphingobacterium lactis TaxID=797291 RepID=UPI003F811D01